MSDSEAEAWAEALADLSKKEHEAAEKAAFMRGDFDNRVQSEKVNFSGSDFDRRFGKF
jgi:hypothetical protein